jgi:hypothetical protein
MAIIARRVAVACDVSFATLSAFRICSLGWWDN